MSSLSPSKFAAVAGIVCSAASTAVAWNNRGHLLAGMIAYAELKPEVRER